RLRRRHAGSGECAGRCAVAPRHSPRRDAGDAGAAVAGDKWDQFEGGRSNLPGGTMKKSFIRGTWQVKHAVSPPVIPRGAARTIYIAGHTGQVDDSGKSLAGDFDAQFKQCFRNIEKTLAEAGAKLGDMVTMTVFLIDARHTTRMTELRTELFGKDFPASAAI